MKSIHELVSKAKNESLTSEEIAYVAKKLETCKTTPNDDVYDYIYILGRGLYGKPIPPEYRKLVEHFLYYPLDPFISTLALDVLCHYWWFVNDYSDVLKQFIRGVDWDENSEVKGSAIINAGFYLKNKRDKELLSMLLEIFEKGNKEDEGEDFNRLLAYCALGLSQGLDWAHLPPYSSRLSALEAEGLLDLAVIEQAHTLLNN